MTAATMTRTRRSAFPTAIEELLPLARDYAAELGTTPSRNQLMRRFRVGDKKAKTLLAGLTPAPLEPEPLPPIIVAVDDRQDDVQAAFGAPSAPVEQAIPDVPELPLTNANAKPFTQYDKPLLTPLVDPAEAALGPWPTATAPPLALDVTIAEPAPRTRLSRYGMGALLTVVGVLLAGVIVAPIALSSQDIIAWAASPIGLGLTGVWPLVTFFALDAAAAVCVGLVVYCAWRGEGAGVFAWLVWAFAGMSAYANYSHSSGSLARDAVWFFPAMSLAGPFLLEIIVRRVRRWVQEGTGQRARHSVSFGFGRWIPGVGALRETYGAWRLARLDGINDASQAVTAYRRLCPDGSIRVLRALRKRGN
ncbi:hypothetical protein [Actinoplanes friuliensis]|uniref:Uncharacterized protein n=1 Tax=Actinoplanes friuliensis DSM 7358 TaxID=1246995 RepID=U5VVF9_9ACTN|nr:hypothetical protein [Actinoplanes friuliensis]AGZ39606.1 hypothetical protein AFR_06585 [Actinoplanes friuliensis DSM 7358]